MTPDGRRAISGSADGTLKVWDLKRGNLQYTLEGHKGRLEAVGIMPDGQRAVSASDDKTLKVWDLNNGGLGSTLTSVAEWRSCGFAHARQIDCRDTCRPAPFSLRQIKR